MRNLGLDNPPGPKLEAGLRCSLIVNLLLDIGLLLTGVLGKNKCPVEKNIPIFIIATGAIGVVGKSLSLLRDIFDLTLKYLELVLYIIEGLLFLVGAYWVLKVYEPKYAPTEEAPLYCDQGLYWFALTYVLLIILLATSALITFICAWIISCFVTPSG